MADALTRLPASSSSSSSSSSASCFVSALSGNISIGSFSASSDEPPQRIGLVQDEVALLLRIRQAQVHDPDLLPLITFLVMVCYLLIVVLLNKSLPNHCPIPGATIY